MVTHDRFVIITLALSISPAPPAPCLAIALVLFQIRLIYRGKLDRMEYPVLLFALVLSVFNLAAITAAVWYLSPTYLSFAAFIKAWLHALSRPWFWFNQPFHHTVATIIPA